MVVEQIHQEGQSNLKRGRYVTILDKMPVKPKVLEHGDQKYLIEDECYADGTTTPLNGVVMQVLAVDAPFVCCRILVNHAELVAGTKVMVDLRRYKMGFISRRFVQQCMGK